MAAHGTPRSVAELEGHRAILLPHDAPRYWRYPEWRSTMAVLSGEGALGGGGDPYPRLNTFTGATEDAP